MLWTAIPKTVKEFLSVQGKGAKIYKYPLSARPCPWVISVHRHDRLGRDASAPASDTCLFSTLLARDLASALRTLKQTAFQKSHANSRFFRQHARAPWRGHFWNLPQVLTDDCFNFHFFVMTCKVKLLFIRSYNLHFSRMPLCRKYGLRKLLSVEMLLFFLN